MVVRLIFEHGDWLRKYFPLDLEYKYEIYKYKHQDEYEYCLPEMHWTLSGKSHSKDLGLKSVPAAQFWGTPLPFQQFKNWLHEEA